MASLAWRTLVVAAMASTAHADQRFYTVMGPDGRLQVIQEASSSTPASASRPVDQNDEKPTVQQQETMAPVGKEAPGGADSGGLARYDSEEFTDVEAVDAVLHKQQSRKRFYLINDGMGEQVRETTPAAADASVDASAGPAVARAGAAANRYRAIQAAYSEMAGEPALESYSGLRECLGRKTLEGLRNMEPDEAQPVVLKREVYQFPDRTGMVEGFRVAGEAARTLIVRSYSRTDRDPAFAEPGLAFLDQHGCLRRVVTGYSDRLYGATDRSHPSLRAEVEMRGDEQYLLVMAIPAATSSGPERPFSPSRYGQIKLILKK